MCLSYMNFLKQGRVNTSPRGICRLMGRYCARASGAKQGAKRLGGGANAVAALALGAVELGVGCGDERLFGAKAAVGGDANADGEDFTG
jgi:hypothetical protein